MYAAVFFQNYSTEQAGKSLRLNLDFRVALSLPLKTSPCEVDIISQQKAHEVSQSLRKQFLPNDLNDST